MGKALYILGINSAYHELAACLIKDGKVVAAVEEERFSRIKHGKNALVSNPDILPAAAIDYCLRSEDIKLSDVQYIGLSFLPQARLRNINIDTYYEDGDWGTEEGEKLFYNKLLSIPDTLGDLAGKDIRDKIQWIPHHLCHAASTFFVSPFKESAILSIDGIGEITSTWLGYGRDNEIHLSKEIVYPHSLGFLWEKLSQFLGFTEYDAGKVSGLAAYGNWKRYYRNFQEIVSATNNGEFIVNNDVLRFRVYHFSSIENLFGLKRCNSLDEMSQGHKDVAAGLQKVTNEIMLNLAAYLSETVKFKNLCMSGGVALNCIANYEIMKSGYFKNIYIQPAAHDAGTALGAAYYIWNVFLSRKRDFVMKHTYWGPEFNDYEIEDLLVKEGVTHEKVDNIELEVAKLLAEGKIVGWFQGRMEWGPRALGNRSLLADPRDPKMKEFLNLHIKARETFRPYAPSVLSEDAKEWFDIPEYCDSMATEFMEIAFPVRAEKRELIPAVTHIDGTSRIQVVMKSKNPKYYRLIIEFKKLTGIPLILNTSFNENEPIVCSPTDALRTFEKANFDYLAINNFLISKS